MPGHLKLGLYQNATGLCQDARGFSFLELMITMAIFVIVCLATFQVIVAQRKTFQAEQEIINTSQSARSSQDILLRELRISGYKVLEAAFLGSLSTWIPNEYRPPYPQSVNFSANTCPIITPGNGSNPDLITIFMADSRENAFAASAASASTAIVLDPNADGFAGGDQFRVNDIIRLGDHTEFARVTAVSGHTLTIDTSPSTVGNQGLANSYNAGAPVREINCITYTVINEANDPSHLHHTAGHPVLKRKHNESDYMDVADDVEDLQIIPATFPNFKLQLITRTATSGNPVSGSPDGFKRVKLLADFRLRNFLKSSCLVPATPSTPTVTGLDSSSPCTIHVTWSAVTRNIDNSTLSSECLVSEYIVAYETVPLTRSYAAYPGNNTSCDIDISGLLDPNHPVNPNHPLDPSHFTDPNHPLFYVSVAAVNAGGSGAYSAERTITDTSHPAAVGNLSGSAVDRAINLAWTHSPECDVVAYHICRATTSGGPFTLIHSDPNIVTGPSTPYSYSYQDNNLSCGAYYYVVSAYDTTFVSANSPEYHASITGSEPPAGPTNFSFTPAAGNSVVFNWTISADDPATGQGDNDVCGYNIYTLPVIGSPVNASRIPAGHNTVTLNSLASNFGLKAVDTCAIESELVTPSVSCQNLPTITISSPSDGATVTGNITITGTASSPNPPLAWIKVKIDGGAWVQLNGISPWSYQWDTSPLTNEGHTITAQVLDSEGCSGTASRVVTVQNETQGADTTPPSFGNILQTPGGNPIAADQSVQICVRVNDPSGISSVIFSTNFGENFTLTDPDLDEVYCAQTPPHNGSTVNYSITAKDNSTNQNQATMSSSYSQSAALPVDHDPPIIGSMTFRVYQIIGNDRTIEFTTTITDTSEISSVTFTYSGNGISGNGTMTNEGGNTYKGRYTRHKNKTCTVTITATDTASPSHNTATSTGSDGGIN